jgi:anti-sigma28 factor (negative regulator of flagellin synthesis)
MFTEVRDNFVEDKQETKITNKKDFPVDLKKIKMLQKKIALGEMEIRPEQIVDKLLEIDLQLPS